MDGSADGGEPATEAATGPASQLNRDEQYWLDLWAFGTSPYGLGLSELDLWRCTPREFTALRSVWQAHRQYHSDLYAGLMTTLHKAHFTGTFTPDQFGGSKPKPKPVDGKLQRERGRAALAAAGAAWKNKQKGKGKNG